MTRWTMFSDVVYYHCSEFQIFRPLNGSHFSVLSLYPNSVQNQAWFCLHFSNHGKPKQTDVIFSRFVSLSLVNHGRLPRENWPIAGFSPLLVGVYAMKNWQGIPTTCLTLGGEVMVPRDNRMLAFGTELLNHIVSFATQGKIRHYNIWPLTSWFLVCNVDKNLL